MSSPAPRPFTAATHKLAYAQAFTGPSGRRHRVVSARARRTLGILRGRKHRTGTA